LKKRSKKLLRLALAGDPTWRDRRVPHRMKLFGFVFSKQTNFLAAVSLGWALSATARADCRMNQVSRLPLERMGSYRLVSVLFNGKPADMIFDTGFDTSVITLRAARRLGLPQMRGEDIQNGTMGTLIGIGGERNSMTITAHALDIGGLKGRDYNMLAADVVEPPADGLLSIDLLSNFDVDLDFPEEQMVLYQPVGDCSAPAAFLASPLYTVPLRPIGEDRRPRVEVTVDGKQVVALIDTGAPRSAIFRRAAERLGIRMDELTSEPRFTTGGIGPDQVEAVTHVFEEVDIGDLAFNNMKIDVLDDHGPGEVDMLLGADFQRKVHLWISYSSHSLIMQDPPRASKRIE
jgi:predicted aspartyl protease